MKAEAMRTAVVCKKAHKQHDASCLLPSYREENTYPDAQLKRIQSKNKKRKGPSKR